MPSSGHRPVETGRSRPPRQAPPPFPLPVRQHDEDPPLRGVQKEGGRWGSGPQHRHYRSVWCRYLGARWEGQSLDNRGGRETARAGQFGALLYVICIAIQLKHIVKECVEMKIIESISIKYYTSHTSLPSSLCFSLPPLLSDFFCFK